MLATAARFWLVSATKMSGKRAFPGGLGNHTAAGRMAWEDEQTTRGESDPLMRASTSDRNLDLFVQANLGPHYYPV